MCVCFFSLFFLSSPFCFGTCTQCELSPAQTLKQMAEQHQHKNTMGMPFANVRSPMGNNPNAPQVNPNRNMVNSGPFANDFGQFNSNDYMSNSTPPNSQFELAAKQEMMFSQQQPHHMPPQMQSKMNPNAYNKQQFPYGSPNTIGNYTFIFSDFPQKKLSVYELVFPPLLNLTFQFNCG